MVLGRLGDACDPAVAEAIRLRDPPGRRV